MRKYINIFLLIFSLSLFSCESFLEPRKENSFTEDQIIDNMSYAEGLLLRAYLWLPDDYYFFEDVVTDDAVTNDMSSSYRRMATGEWKSSFDPLSVWSTAYTAIYYINKFLEIYESVDWANDPRLSREINEYRNNLYKQKLKGEAFALRAWYKYRLLLVHGGKTEDGRLLGFPIVNNSLSPTDNWKLPRNTYAECVTSIFTDLDNAINALPVIWADKPTGGANPLENAYYNLICGAKYENRINGRIAQAIKARVALLAASPSFSEGSGITWEQAAEIAGNLLKDLGSLYSNTSEIYNHTFYKEIRNKEILWNRAQTQKRTWEQNNFPPSLFGYGMTNPTQNLVDAFPMKNGYPISHASGNYDPENPYSGRDNRFYQYIIYDNSLLKGSTIRTYAGASSNGINVLTTSTRTGYYLKKFMAEGVNLNPASLTNTAHTFTFLRMTEVLLNYVEAANEAWGPDGDPKGFGFTARSKIAELRLRAGITTDEYLPTISNKSELRELIRNERRISLCFEGFRFWDIRRWNDVSLMQAPVKAAFITLEDGNRNFEYEVIEERKYEPYMIYGPVPYNETLKYNLAQNKGWQ